MLAGQVAYVSGGAGAIGAAIARRLAGAGARVVVGDADAAAAERVAAALREGGHEAIGVAHDVTDRAAADAAVARCREAFGGIDVVCANAGIARFAPVLELTDADWDATLAVNVTGVLYTLQAFGAALVEQGSGAIVVTASISSKRGAPLLGAYSASKFAVIGLAQSLAKEVAGRGVRVNAVCPGPVEGPLAEAMVAANAAAFGQGVDAARAELVAPAAFGRLARPDEIADAVLFLVSPLSAFVTGQTVTVDGGMLA